ncbi:MAG: response regulator [Nodosilinea sp.]
MDDDRVLLTVILEQHNLEQQGAEVRSTGTVRKAIEVLERFRPDVILSDIGMPTEDGYSFLEKVRAA